jgi:hypothetical protein
MPPFCCRFRMLEKQETYLLCAWVFGRIRTSFVIVGRGKGKRAEDLYISSTSLTGKHVIAELRFGQHMISRWGAGDRSGFTHQVVSMDFDSM